MSFLLATFKINEEVLSVSSLYIHDDKIYQIHEQLSTYLTNTCSVLNKSHAIEIDIMHTCTLSHSRIEMGAKVSQNAEAVYESKP